MPETDNSFPEDESIEAEFVNNDQNEFHLEQLRMKTVHSGENPSQAAPVVNREDLDIRWEDMEWVGENEDDEDDLTLSQKQQDFQTKNPQAIDDNIRKIPHFIRKQKNKFENRPEFYNNLNFLMGIYFCSQLLIGHSRSNWTH
jgi:hypothetical protein